MLYLQARETVNHNQFQMIKVLQKRLTKLCKNMVVIAFYLRNYKQIIGILPFRQA